MPALRIGRISDSGTARPNHVQSKPAEMAASWKLATSQPAKST